MKRIITAAAALIVLGGCATPMSGNWATLFDGTTLSNFNQVGNANWRIEDRAAVANAGSGFLVTKVPYGDFEMRMEFWADHDTNSGIFYRCGDAAKITATNCYEANIWDARPDPNYGTGAIVNVAMVYPMPRAGGKWNTYAIHAIGERMILTLNGQVTVDVRDPKLKNGLIALQFGEVKGKPAVVRFRNVQVRPL
jgi:hypothetical protein